MKVHRANIWLIAAKLRPTLGVIHHNIIDIHITHSRHLSDP
jgi:hypothetical protein